MFIRHRRALPALCITLVGFLLTSVGAPAGLDYRPIAAAAPKPLPAIGPTTAAEMEAFVDGFMAAAMKKGPVAGATVAVVKDGGLFFSKGYGFEDVEKRVVVDPAMTLFRPGSVSKLFTWTAVMQLVEQGKLDLDTDVNEYLTDIKIPATFSEPITLRNIMTHTTGFEDGGVGYLFAASEKDSPPLKDFLAKHMPARVRPPTRDFSNGGINASYSNYATAIAGRIIELVSGMSYDDYIEQHIFQPLGMTRSTFREPLPAELAKRMAKSYVFENAAPVAKGFEFIHGIGPAGSLSSTATDMSRFIAAHLQEGALGDARILRAETARLMHTRAMSPDPALNGHALGFYETWINGHRIIGHGGDTLTFHSALSMLPEAHLGLFVSVNTGGQGARLSVDLERAFYQHYFPAELPKLKVRADANQRNAKYAGTYRTLRRSHTAWEKAFDIMGDEKVTAMPDGTLLHSVLGEPARWIEVGEGVFRAANDDLFLSFKNDQSGSPAYIVGYFPPISGQRIAWYETGMLTLILSVVSVVLFVAMIVSAVRKRRIDRDGPRNIRWARPALAVAGGLLLLFLVLLALVFAGGLEELIFKVPTLLYIALALPLLALVPAAAALYFVAVVWKSAAWRMRTRIYYSVTTLAAILFLWILSYWKLLGYHFG